MANPFNIIANMVAEAERHAEALSKDRIRATEYYQGTMRDTPSDKGRSSMVTRDVRANIKKVLPSIVRTILSTDEVVEFTPVGPEDEEAAKQASDYVNYVLMQECEGRDAIYDAVHDALLLRNGVLKWWFDERKGVKISTHTGLPDEAFFALAGDDEVDVLEHTERQEIIDQGGQEMPVMVHDCKVRRTTVERNLRAAAVPRERFLIHPDAVTLDDSLLTGEKTTMRRSDLVAMGYDRETIDALSTAEDDDYESDLRRDAFTDNHEDDSVTEEIDYYDIFIRIDMDDDGIAELHHMCFAGGLKEKHLLVDEECDEVQFADIAVMRQPHQWEGVSLADDLMDLQKGKTVLFRQTLDNIYWQNNLQPVIQDGALVDDAEVFAPEFGKPIRVNPGVDVRAAVGYNPVPFVAAHSFAMMEYMDQEAEDRTGVSDASSGLAPDALQNMTAKASAMIEAAGIGQTELMVKTVASGLRRFFRGLLRLTITHQDVPRTVRMRGEWVQFDPRQWNANMDCNVNTGLGAGTRERDMMMMQQVMLVQEKMLAMFGPDNPFVKASQVYNATAKLIEAAGLKNPALYFTDPDPAEVEAQLKALREAPNPEQMKIQAQMQLEQAKMQANVQSKQAEMQAAAQLEQQKMQMSMALEQAKMQASTEKEKAQMAADVATGQQERQTQMLLAAQELAFRREELQERMQLEWAKLSVSAIPDDPKPAVAAK